MAAKAAIYGFFLKALWKTKKIVDGGLRRHDGEDGLNPTARSINTKQMRLSDRRGSMSVELALTGAFVLLPMLAGGADFVDLMCARSQLNATLRSLYAYAWNNPATATNTTQLAAILAIVNQHSLPQVTFPDGKADASTTYVPVLTYGCVVPPSTTISFQTTSCPASSQQQELMVTYAIISSVTLPVPIPFGLPNPFVLTATGQVEIQ